MGEMLNTVFKSNIKMIRNFANTPKIFIDENTKLVVQGLTGGQGTFHATKSIE